MKQEAPIRLAAVLGTTRPGNYTAMALRLVVDEVSRMDDVSLEILDPGVLGLAFPGMGATDGSKRLQESIKAATGVIFATPEYHGSFSSVTKLVIENLGFPSVLAGKPIALLGVAQGVIGAIKSLEHLRGVCSHVGGLVLPGSVSVANVRTVFDSEGRCLDPKVDERVRSVPKTLVDYIRDKICPKITLESMVRERA